MGEPAPIYDDDESDRPITRPDLDVIEGGKADSTQSPEELRAAEESGEGGGDEQPYDEDQALSDRLGTAFGRAKEQDEEEGGLFRDDDEQVGRFQKAKTTLGSLSKNKRALGVGGGVLGIFLVGASMFSFLNVFRLDHVFNNIDAKTFARFNASFEGRSDKYLKSYIQLRLTELDGDVKGDTAVFRADKVDTNNPIRDWYRTMRTSKFEQELLDRHGIQFTSSRDASGKIRPGVINIRDKSITIDVDGEGTRITDALGRDKLAFNKLDDSIKKSIDLSLFGDANGVGGSREARRAIKGAVNDNTKSWQVFKRRHLRKDIANMTGIRNWRFFEKTRDKVDARKIAIQRKIINKVFVGNSNSAKLLKCILGAAKCPVTSDPSDPENKSKGVGSGASAVADDQDQNIDDDNDGKNEHTARSRGADVTDDAGTAAKEAAKRGAAESADEVINKSPIQKYVINMVGSVAGGGPFRAWSWARRLTAVHELFSSTDGRQSKIVKLVKNARMAQLAATYATYAMAKDQVKSGELVGDELNNFMGTMENFGNSEGWSRISNSGRNGKVSAQASDNPSKEEYCSTNHVKSFEKNEFAWMCDSQKPNGGSNAQSITDAYDSSFGEVIGPIADTVNGIKSVPFLSTIADAFESAISKIINATVAPAINGLLEVTGLGSSLAEVITALMSKLMEFLGAGPMFDGSQPGVANLLMAGSAGTAESTTRASGGIASTKKSLAYSNQLAANHQKDKHDSQSLFTRYASLNNQESLASTTLFNVSNSNVASSFARFSNISKTISSVFSTFTPSVFAQTTDEDAAATAQWAGVDTYDIPQQCVDLDPLAAGYLEAGTNAQSIGVALTWDLVRDTDKFWAAVYEKARELNDIDPESITNNIYNCHLLDTRVQGGLGNVYGYEKDNGYQAEGTGQSTGSPNGGGIVGDPFSSSADVACAPNTIDLGNTHKGYNAGTEIALRLCAIPNIPGGGSESTPGNGFFIQGADKMTIVTSRISGAMYAMAETAKQAGVQLTSRSSFRSMAHQEQLWARNPNRQLTGRPGYSNHQSGTAVDFAAGDVKNAGATCSSGRATAPGNAQWDWLSKNAPSFGFKQLATESWHFDPSPSESRCGPP